MPGRPAIDHSIHQLPLNDLLQEGSMKQKLTLILERRSQPSSCNNPSSTAARAEESGKLKFPMRSLCNQTESSVLKSNSPTAWKHGNNSEVLTVRSFTMSTSVQSKSSRSAKCTPRESASLRKLSTQLSKTLEKLILSTAGIT